MSIELAALILSILGPVVTGWALYLRGKRTASAVRQIRVNEVAHLEARLEQIEARLFQVEGWMFEHNRQHVPHQ